MDESSVDTKYNETKNVVVELKYEMDVEMETKEKIEEVVTDQGTFSLHNSTSEKSTDETFETLSKRKNDTEVSEEPQTKRKRITKVPNNTKNTSSTEVVVVDGDDINVTENELSEITSSATEKEP